MGTAGGAESKAVVVTGVSTGIGFGLVEELVSHGFLVFGSVRKETDAAKLSSRFGQSFTPLIFDVTDEADVRQAAEQASAIC